jgi:hypothetical protein
MQEILPGLFHWTTFHTPIGADVSSYHLVSAAAVIDPKLPEGGIEALREHGDVEQVILSTGLHTRDAQEIAKAFDCPIRVSFEGQERIGGALETVPYGWGDEVAPGVRAVEMSVLAPDDGVLHLDVDEGAIAFADSVTRYGGALGFFPDELLGAHPQRVKEGIKNRCRALLQRDFDHLLFAHGDPLVGGGKAALRDFATSPVGHPEFGQAL